MKHWFITNDGDLPERWEKALPGILPSRPDALSRRLWANDVVWLSTKTDEWQSLIASATARQANVVILSYSPNDSEALMSLELGARGYVHTLASPDVLRQVAMVVSNHGVWVGQELLAKVIGGSFKALNPQVDSDESVDSGALHSLTEREKGVALEVLGGATNKEVAYRLSITERTVKAHLAAIFRKLAVRDRLQLILKLAPAMERSQGRL